MSIIGDIFEKMAQDSDIAKKFGMDSNNAEHRVNLATALKQIEGVALGYKEKPIDEIRKAAFDMSKDSLLLLGRETLNQIFSSGEIPAEIAKSVAMDSQALYGAPELTTFDPRFFEIEHQILLWRTLFPITHIGRPADEQFSYKLERLVGQANLDVGARSNTQYKVDVIEEDRFVKYHDIDVEFEITNKDMRAAVQTGRPIEVRKMKASVRSSEQQMNDAVIFGTSDPAFYGFINNPLLVKAEVVEGAAAAGNKRLWVNKTPKEVVQGDVGNQISIMRQTSFRRHSPTHMGLADAKYDYLAHTWLSDLNPHMSLLQYMLEENAAYGLEKIVPMPELTGAGPGGSDMGLFWENHGNDDVLQVDIPMELFFGAPVFQPRKMVFVGEARISDLILRRLQGVRAFYGF